jgi:hypothetical protein
MGTAFTCQMDIQNRAIQACGVQRIESLTEDTLQAAETTFCYDKLRRAELRRNVWTFATRKAALRPITTGVMFLNPNLWSFSAYYGFGDIVVDANGILWQSRAQDNTNYPPGYPSTQWDVYSGPLSITPYDITGTTGYFAGELVYQSPGDGSYNVYLSLQSGNTQDPRAPSQWQNTVQYSKDNVVVYYPAWSISTTYASGNTVSYNGNDYVSLMGSNTANEPDVSPHWAKINSALAPVFYSSLTTYSIGQFVTYQGVNYVSLIINNLDNTPSSSPSDWQPQQAGTFYVSLVDFNLNNNPASSPLQWSSINNFSQANDQWWKISCTLSDLLVVYPIGAGPTYQTFTKNAYRLPANFLRKAPQDPKAGSTSFLGAPTGLMYDDWNWENNFIVTRESYPILLRFVADVQDVSQYDDMFCEGLALRIAMEVVERLTQSTTKKADIAKAYKTVMGEARLVNAIINDSDESPEDDYITCRI